MNMNWKPILGWEDFYMISDTGVVMNIKTNKVKKSFLNNFGYMRVTLENKNHNPTKQRFYIHRLVAIHFLPNPRNCEEVNHIDCNTQNNNVKNLEWVTKQENELHSHKFGSKEYKPFIVVYNNGDIKKFDIKQSLADEIDVTASLVKDWLHKKSFTFPKYGIKKIKYI